MLLTSASPEFLAAALGRASRRIDLVELRSSSCCGRRSAPGARPQRLASALLEISRMGSAVTFSGAARGLPNHRRRFLGPSALPDPVDSAQSVHSLAGSGVVRSWWRQSCVAMSVQERRRCGGSAWSQRRFWPTRPTSPTDRSSLGLPAPPLTGPLRFGPEASGRSHSRSRCVYSTRGVDLGLGGRRDNQTFRGGNQHREIDRNTHQRRRPRTRGTRHRMRHDVDHVDHPVFGRRRSRWDRDRGA